ncbi:hypothetical protein PR048_015683 [Dryococelus australis]|uniref:Uncharacterized protein n=1 Tax=Dryococelus australis TaxID=614101 RepID=A0ABQ9HHL3_9NEOP|nr:hypothetical protein PR048_015683 [Dryococelus australis]
MQHVARSEVSVAIEEETIIDVRIVAKAKHILGKRIEKLCLLLHLSLKIYNSLAIHLQIAAPAFTWLNQTCLNIWKKVELKIPVDIKITSSDILRANQEGFIVELAIVL